MPNFIDLTGQKFSKLTVVELVERASRKTGNPTRWRCLCECGKETVVQGRYLYTGRTRSCGCRRSEAMRETFRTHGEGGKFVTLEYQSWSAMRARCRNPKNPKYHCYGARGIRVCERWDSYENFLEDMGRKPSPGHSLDRINVNKNYEPSNCRWIGPREQYWNRQDSLGQLFIGVARSKLSREMFDMIWQEALELQNEKTAK